VWEVQIEIGHDRVIAVLQIFAEQRIAEDAFGSSEAVK
jgi:hypothetical protein